MNEIFEKKKQAFLRKVHSLAVLHNRGYFTSLIPYIEKMTETENDLLDEYIAAL